MTTQEYVQILNSRYQKVLLNKGETAKELGISIATLDRLRKSGEISSKKVKGQIFFPIATIAEFIAL